MKNRNKRFTANELRRKIKFLIKNEIVAIYSEEETTLDMRFLDGRTYRISIEEVLSIAHA